MLCPQGQFGWDYLTSACKKSLLNLARRSRVLQYTTHLLLPTCNVAEARASGTILWLHKLEKYAEFPSGKDCTFCKAQSLHDVNNWLKVS